MKFLKYLLYAIGILVVIAIVMGLTGPKTYDVSRSAIVSGTPEQVWPYVSSLKNMQQWSPWAEKDTAMVMEYSGTDGTVGSSYTWSGNDEVGKGSQALTDLQPHTYVESELKFREPMESITTGYTRLADTTGGTFVIWGIKGENSFVGRIFATILNMDKMVGPDFEKGLNNLTALMANTSKSASPSYEVIPGEYPGGKYLGVRGSIPFDKMTEFYSTNFPALFPALAKGGAQPAGMPCGLYYSWDEENATTDLAAAVSFTGEMKAPIGMEVIKLPAAKSLTINYLGGYHGLGGAHMAMDEYIGKNKLEPLTPAIEEYVSDPGSEPDSTKWLTKVTYFVK